ncbi:MAG: Ig-like domain-containing protein [Myxococcota bacterium]
MFFVALVGCGQVPAAVQFAGDEKVTVYGTDAVAVQAATVNDKDGKALDKQPELKWTVSDEAVAKLEGDKLTPLKSGNAMVKACATDTVCKEYTFVVALPEKVVVGGNEGVEWKVGATANLTAKVMSGETEVPNQTLAWASDNTAVVTVDDKGMVTAVAPGTANVTATAGALNAAVALTIVDAAAAPTN